MDNFSLAKANELYFKGLKKDHLDAVEYVLKYFFPLDAASVAGGHGFYHNNDVHILKDDVIFKTYLNKIGGTAKNDVKSYYLTKTTKLYELVCDPKAPLIDYKAAQINVSGRFKHTYKKYSSFSDRAHKKVDLMLSFIKEVWANNDDVMYEYLLNYFAYMVNPNGDIKHNESILYARGGKGIGKSKLLEFLRDHVFGLDVTCNGQLSYLTGSFNSSMKGKVLVTFEELPSNLSTKEWQTLDKNLKDCATNKISTYSEKYMNDVTVSNINNLIITSNYNPISSSGDRRYVCLDINCKYKEDFEYFGKLHKNCFNDKVGHAFFCMLHERDLTNYNSREIPATITKALDRSNRMPLLSKFLKFRYLMKNKPVHMKRLTFTNLYNEYTKEHGVVNKVSIQYITKALLNIGVYCKQGKGQFKGAKMVKLSVDDLKTMAKRDKWMNDDTDADEFLQDQQRSTDQGSSDSKRYVKHLEALLEQSRTENDILREILSKDPKMVKLLEKRLAKAAAKNASTDDIEEVEDESDNESEVEESSDEESDEESDESDVESDEESDEEEESNDTTNNTDQFY